MTDEAVIKLLEEMSKGNDDGRGLALGHVRNSLHNIDSSDRLYNSLIERKVFQLGWQTKCPHCGRASWYSINTLGSVLTCPLCYQDVDAIQAVDTSRGGQWFLRTAGGFSVKNYAEGSYSVLLTLNFFERGMHYETTPVLSFKAKSKNRPEIEADFGMLWRERAFGDTDDGVLFAECKSYNKFKKRDYDRMKTIAAEFPGAILAFCTLRKALDPDEVRAISTIARRGTRLWKAERPINPVLILTGNELFSLHGIPYCWEGMTVPAWAQHPRNLLEICNATQGLYLGMPPWYETWEGHFKKRRLKKRARTVQGGGARSSRSAASTNRES